LGGNSSAEVKIANSAAYAYSGRTGSSATAAVDGGKPGSYAYAYAIRGAKATASATAAPMCSPGTSGIAMVRSSMGNCGP
jgi:hypothetical protein